MLYEVITTVFDIPLNVLGLHRFQAATGHNALLYVFDTLTVDQATQLLLADEDDP